MKRPVPPPAPPGGPSPALIASVCDAAAIPLPPGAAGKLAAHAAEMLRWNRAVRLTAITDSREVAVKHILDSLLLLRMAPFPGRILDFGSGAGYPGIPLAVLLPEAHLVLLEASAKKCAFLARVRFLLGLSNVQVVRGRLEPRVPAPVGPFDHVVTRATLPPDAAVPLLAPLLAPGGRILLMRGAKAPSLPPGIRPARRETVDLPFGMGRREILEIVPSL